VRLNHRTVLELLSFQFVASWIWLHSAVWRSLCALFFKLNCMFVRPSILSSSAVLQLQNDVQQNLIAHQLDHENTQLKPDRAVSHI
jgi:hypothetical protein